MKNQELRSSLIKSGVILGICILLIYAFAASDSGGVGGTIGSLFSLVLFIIGLFVALVVSVALLIGLYFAVLYFYDQRNCKKTYDEFKEKMTVVCDSYKAQCGCSTAVEAPTPLSETDLAPLLSAQDRQNGQVTGLQNSMDSLAATVSTLSTSVRTLQEELGTMKEQAAELAETVETKASTGDIDDSAKKLAADISSIQSSVSPLSDKLSQLEETIGGLAPGEEGEDAVQEKVDQAVGTLNDEIAALKASIAEMGSPAQADEGDDGEHKILSYFSAKKDKEKFIALVTEAVEKEMTYAQAGELLDGSLSAKAKEVTAKHPSLTKDYIKDVRQQNKS